MTTPRLFVNQRLVACFEESKTLARAKARCRPTLLGEPRCEGITSEVLLHHHPGHAVGREPREPGGEQIMERGLADSNWWIRENQVKRGVGRDLAARTKVRVGEVVCGCVRLGEGQRPVV